jgi:hypothetical protein
MLVSPLRILSPRFAPLRTAGTEDRDGLAPQPAPLNVFQLTTIGCVLTAERAITRKWGAHLQTGQRKTVATYCLGVRPVQRLNAL